MDDRLRYALRRPDLHRAGPTPLGAVVLPAVLVPAVLVPAVLVPAVAAMRAAG